MISYAGIGSRKTPQVIIAQMKELGFQAAKAGWNLRSGAAPGADQAFELGCIDAVGQKQIFIPWKGFAQYPGEPFALPEKAFELAATIHPAWSFLKPPARKLVARNMQQILGPNLDDPVEMVICWTPDGCETKEQYGIKTGGTGTAIALASVNGIRVFNLKRPKRYEQAMTIIKGIL